MLTLGAAEQKIAFSVHLLTEGSTTTTLNPGSLVLFNRITMNLGDGFNLNSGSFHVPVQGIYSITLYFMTSHDTGSGLGIYVNNEKQCTNWAAATHNIGFCSIFKELKKGDVVNVKVFHEQGATLYTHTGENAESYKNQNGFVGFLYKPT